MDKAEDFDFNQGVIELHQELAVLKVKLANQEWASKKTNQGIKILYKELEKKNQELKKLDELKSDFISMVSHELRTPLTTIREAVSQVLDGILGETTAGQRDFLSICLKDIDRLKRIIDNLLDISKIEAGKIKLNKKYFDLVGLIKGLASTFTPRASSKGLEIKIDCRAEKIQTCFDRDKIIQVFHNLIGNALKFTESGFILISLSDKGSKIECSVSDTGQGIHDDDIPQVFRRFQQFARATGPGEKGTGLGLAISKGMVELHKGEIWVESPPVSPVAYTLLAGNQVLNKKENSGTAFVFTLPKYSFREYFEESLFAALGDCLKDDSPFVLVRFSFDNSYNSSLTFDRFLADCQSLISRSISKEIYFIIRDEKSIFLILPLKDKNTVLGMIENIKTLLSDFISKQEAGRSLMPKVDFSEYQKDGITAQELISGLDK